MTPDQLREIETTLGFTHGALARQLGISEVSVKRMATGAQVITEQTARQLGSLLVVHLAGLQGNFAKVLAKYHGDTIISTVASTAQAVFERYKMKVPHYYDNNKLYVPLASWSALKDDPDSEPYRDLVQAATEIVKGGGAFIVYRESDTSIMHRCDRMSELNELV